MGQTFVSKVKYVLELQILENLQHFWVMVSCQSRFSSCFDKKKCLDEKYNKKFHVNFAKKKMCFSSPFVFFLTLPFFRPGGTLKSPLVVLKMRKEIMMNLCYKIWIKNLFRENHRLPGNVWEARNHNDNTNIHKCDKKYSKGGRITVYWDLCVSVAYF